MKTTFCLLLAALLTGGCASTVPVSAIPGIKQEALCLRPSSNTNFTLVFSSARGRNASHAGGSGGVIGVAIGASVAASAESGGTRLVRKLRQANGNFEAARITNSIQARLLRSGMTLVADQPRNELVIEVRAVGLLEPQRGFWVPFARVSARVIRESKKEIWNTFVSSTGTKYRRLEEFSDHPELYSSDFAELSEDIARQVVDGPIRR